jgi:hypothetical protein
MLEVLPARIDFFGFVLQGSGFAAFLGTGVSLYRRQLAGAHAPLVPSYAERYTVVGAVLSAAVSHSST